MEHFSTRLTKNHHIINDFVHVIFQDSDKRIWIGTRDGILIYNKEKKSFIPFNDFFRNPSLPDLRGYRINNIIRDKRENYYVATQNGLIRFNLKDGSAQRFTTHSEDHQKLSGNLVYSILEDHLGLIWISTSNGLDVYNPATSGMTHFKKVEGSVNSISDNFVISLCEDHSGNIWIGTGSGVNKFDRKDSSFICYSHENGFPNDQIFDILEDDNYTLWFTTGSGLFRLDVAKGFNSFYPDSLNDNRYLPEIVITAFTKTNRDGKMD